MTIRELLEHLKERQLVGDSSIESIKEALSKENNESVSAWYIRALVVLGAWASSGFFIAFLLISKIISLSNSREWLVWGFIWISAATVIRAFVKKIFPIQLALAMSVAGHILFLAGVAEYGIETVASVSVILSLILYLLYTDAVHRFLSVVSSVALIIGWIFDDKAYYLLHGLLFVEILGAGVLFINVRMPARLRPLAYALAVSIPMTLLLITEVKEVKTPWWPSSFLLVIGLILLYGWVAGGFSKLLHEPLSLVVVSTLVLGIVSTPGVLASIGLLVLGYALHDLILLGLAAVFFPTFIWFYYYDMNVSLAFKSLILIGSGIVLVIAKWFLNEYKIVYKTPIDLAMLTSAREGIVKSRVYLEIATLILILVVTNGLIFQKQLVLKSGRTMLLKLAPVDPRSLMQGDYMALRYELENQVSRQNIENLPPEGCIVVTLDDQGIATFVRVHKGEPLGEGEYLLRYRRRGNFRLGADAFFFQEGHAKDYELARYGELKVTSSGDSVLVGLRNEKLERLDR
jgi:uncharacterized membrane-anchored protein